MIIIRKKVLYCNNPYEFKNIFFILYIHFASFIPVIIIIIMDLELAFWCGCAPIHYTICSLCVCNLKKNTYTKELFIFFTISAPLVENNSRSYLSIAFIFLLWRLLFWPFDFYSIQCLYIFSNF